MPRLFRQLLAVVCAAAWPWRGPNPKDDDSPLEVSEEFLEVGRPLLIQDLAPHSTRCFPLAVEALTSLRVLASVVGLAGFPALRAGWTPVRPGLEDGSETGLETLHQVVENKHRETRFFFCVRTFSLQGCDALLTVLTEESTLVQLRPNYPSVWQLGFGAGAGWGPSGPASLAFSVEPDFLEDTRITVLPVSGEVDVAVYANASVGNCSGRLLKASSLSGPDIVDVPPGHGQLCVLATGRGIVSVVAGPPFPGPFVIPAIPTAGLLTGCEQSRLWVNNGTDITVTAVADDASEITLGATLAKEALENRWKGVVPPGGSGAALVISGAEVAAAERSLGLAKKEAAVSLVTCRKDLRSEATRYWLTAVTETGVISLQDGVVAHASVGEDVWRDFRLLVGTKGEVTLSASSAGKVSLVADTARREHFLGYRWAAKHNGGNSRAVIRLTTDPQQVSQEVFEYSLKRNDTAVVISARSRVPAVVLYSRCPPSGDPSKKEESGVGAMSWPDFPESPLTTRRAEAVVLLEPSANAFQAAVHAAEPVLYVRVENPEEKVSSRFSVCARAEGHAKWLHNGAAADGAVKAWRYDRYRFFVTAAEASELLEMIVEVSPHRGSVVVYASCEPNQSGDLSEMRGPHDVSWPETAEKPLRRKLQPLKALAVPDRGAPVPAALAGAAAPAVELDTARSFAPPQRERPRTAEGAPKLARVSFPAQLCLRKPKEAPGPPGPFSKPGKFVLPLDTQDAVKEMVALTANAKGMALTEGTCLTAWTTDMQAFELEPLAARRIDRTLAVEPIELVAERQGGFQEGPIRYGEGFRLRAAGCKDLYLGYEGPGLCWKSGEAPAGTRFSAHGGELGAALTFGRPLSLRRVPSPPPSTYSDSEEEEATLTRSSAAEEPQPAGSSPQLLPEAAGYAKEGLYSRAADKADEAVPVTFLPLDRPDR
ncbi:unnamed protein product [Effrenium voratum]|nr:unnamed protein product [Effrenium voratum]